MLTTEQKLWCGVAHLGWMLGVPILAPLIIMLVSDDYFVKNQAKEALAFQIGMVIFTFIFGILSIILIGLPFLALLSLGGLIFPIIAMMKICDNVDYSYPITGNFARKNL
ncbi:DUF4870 domain-containing protein [Anaerophilus nitritogenes]|uniref:DUF4870 domain-containing protein n=1 Tax=Anaerophilus nitritogenes TaxID=2498136 RepID=UPI00101B7D2B|nr:DUF4870 domain-containing protein [Anaerophilus nitritogenes]